jgi:hypothetical protein
MTWSQDAAIGVISGGRIDAGMRMCSPPQAARSACLT